jgi:hypothetical protein
MKRQRQELEITAAGLDRHAKELRDEIRSLQPAAKAVRRQQ